jgi:hypothetical protein
VWWFPKPDTDWANIKQNIQTTIDTCHEFDNVPATNQSYQFAVTAAQTTCNQIDDFLSDNPSSGVSIQDFTTFNSAVAWLEVLFVVVGVLSGLTAALKWDDN